MFGSKVFQVESFSSNGKRECADGIYPDRRDGPAAAGGSSETFDNNSRFTLVNNPEVYALKAAPGETTNVIAEHPEAVATLRAADDKWWDEVQPLLVTENVVGPKLNPMKVLD